ncbi:MAG: type IV pilin N-terminal domain-containing protein [Thermoplasmatales archaeon]|nr:type IV pilin N-terminal domain-containing protein [Thermoplasmatales archaeon]
MKIKRADDAVSEIIGTVLLLMIVVAVFSGISIFVLAPPSDIPQPFVTIVGKVEEMDGVVEDLGNLDETADVVLIHRGGKSISLDSKILMTIGSTIVNMTVGNCLDAKSKEDGAWTIGEQIVYPIGNETYLHVEITIVDVTSNSVIFMGVVQTGSMIVTKNVFNVQHNASTLIMGYDFEDYGSGRLRFAYKKQSEDNWEYTAWNPNTGDGIYHKRVAELSCETTYLFRAELKYEGTTIVSGVAKSFTTSDCLT